MALNLQGFRKCTTHIPFLKESMKDALEPIKEIRMSG